VDALTNYAQGADAGVMPTWATADADNFKAAVNDDLNIPGAMAALFNLVRQSNSAVNSGELEVAEAAALLELLKNFDQVLGVIWFERRLTEDIPAEIQRLIDARATARAEKNWSESDRLRDELIALGWSVRDSKDGQKVKRA
jgi:cysteinyl-tRNA synthetase